MNVLAAPVLLGAALVSAPAFWAAFVDGTTEPQTALVRFVVAAVLTWAALNVLSMLVGPSPSRAGGAESPVPGAPVGMPVDEPVAEPAG